MNFWHSAEFTWDGQYVVFDDESLGNDTCQPGNQGRIRIYRVSDAHLMSSYMIPRPQGNYCSVHNGNLIPVAGRYLLVAAWYFGGTSVIDFTNPSNPHEIALLRPGGKPDGRRGLVLLLVQRQDLHERHPARSGRLRLVLPATMLRRYLHAPERADAGRAAAVAVRDAGPVTRVQAPRALTGRWARQERPMDGSQ